MIYLDTSVVLAQLFAEDRRPPMELWRHPLVSSRLLEYEVWNRVHAHRLAASHGESVRGLLQMVAMVELSPAVLERAREPFPAPVRTLDALHLASLEFLRSQRQEVSLASYDARMVAVAKKLKLPVFSL